MEASALRAPAGLARLALPSALLRLRSDEQLVSLFRQGNEDAFRVIHDRYRARLFAYTRQMLGGSRSDAEDALQDVFMRAYHALPADDRPVALRAWLYRVAHNRCIDHLRRPVPPAADVFDVSRAPLPDPLAEAERRDDLRRLVADVQALPEQQRSALLMRELEGLSYADLAAALETSIPAVKSLLVRARIGLVEAAEARNTACTDIQQDLALSFGKGVRASARARRHMRDCEGCQNYRTSLRAVRTGLHSLSPGGGHPLGLIAKLLGLGGASGGAAAGGTAAAGGGGAAISVVGGGAVAATAKVAAVVCCAALTAGSAVELNHHAKRPASGSAKRVTAAAAAQLPGTAGGTFALRAEGAAPPLSRVHATEAARGKDAAAKKKDDTAPADPAAAPAEDPITPHTTDGTDIAAVPPGADTAVTGGAQAPDEPGATATGTTTTAATGTAGTAPAGTTSSTTTGTQTASVTTQSSGSSGSTTSTTTSPGGGSTGGGPTATTASTNGGSTTGTGQTASGDGSR